ncbi:PREDICTED: uncharacterized protein LOC107336447 [Acropora digitifera]|uniref:uncharacterized protein LOC107336447 n=1 Tax=Acropora digitifera TaxID=70779 RepID=UPI000779F49D|nr:PREDICTED: uncharacterized protein LOC107336447 [Acropora digitifera]
MMISSSFLIAASLTVVLQLSIVLSTAETPNLRPGDIAPPFVLEAKANLSQTKELLKYKTGNDSNIDGPIIFLAYTSRSGFLERLFSKPDCFQELLENSPDDVNYVFLSFEDSGYCCYHDTQLLNKLAKKFKDTLSNYYYKRLKQEMKLTLRVEPSHRTRRSFGNGREPRSRDFQSSWMSRLHFSLYPVFALGNWIPRVLSQWFCSGHNCGLDQIVLEDAQGYIMCAATRLDARYDWLPSPTTLSKYGRLQVVYVGDACSSNRFYSDVTGNLALVANGGCSYFTKVQNCQSNGALGVIVYSNKYKSLDDMNCQGTECNTQLNIPATMIGFDTGSKIRNCTLSSQCFVRFQNTPSDVFAFGIDGQGRVQETGWFLYPSMQFLAYQAQWFNYMTKLLSNLTEDAVIVNVFNHTVLQGADGITATVDLPSLEDLQHYEHVELDFSLACPGSMDDPCPHWDHVIQLYVCCNATSELCGLELGRWITPFRRRIGRWLTPVKPLIPLLQSADSSSRNKCNFTMKTAPWAMAWIPTLNIRLVTKIQALNQYNTFHSMETTLVPFQIVPLFRGGTFDKNYNTKYSPFNFPMPQGTDRVKLVAVITGHGSDNNNCAEFCVTSHHFIVNKKINFTRVFKNAGTALGCADRVPEGVIPNEHGTWLYGRDGWCDGQEVIPWVVDITGALKHSYNVIEYFGWFNNTDPNPTRDPGLIRMYSYLVYYKYLN